MYTFLFSLLPKPVQNTLAVLAAPILIPMFTMWIGEGMLGYEMAWMHEYVLPVSEAYMGLWKTGIKYVIG